MRTKLKQKTTVEELQVKVAKLEERISVLEELLLKADEAEEQSHQGDMIQTQGGNIDVKIRRYFYIIELTIKNKCSIIIDKELPLRYYANC